MTIGGQSRPESFDVRVAAGDGVTPRRSGAGEGLTGHLAEADGDAGADVFAELPNLNP